MSACADVDRHISVRHQQQHRIGRCHYRFGREPEEDQVSNLLNWLFVLRIANHYRQGDHWVSVPAIGLLRICLLTPCQRCQGLHGMFLPLNRILGSD